MKTATSTIDCLITSKTPEALHAAEAIARRASDLNVVTVDQSIAFPGGVERVQERRYRVGDYFDNVELLDDLDESRHAFRLIFHVKPGVSGYWKDVLERILRAITDTGAQIEVIQSSN